MSPAATDAVPRRTEAPSLRPLFDPRSVAVVGASANSGKWGYWLSTGAQRGAHRRAVYLVNGRGGELLGQQAHARLADLPEAPELVVVGVPAGAVAGVVDEALEQGAKAIVAVASGFAESGAEGRAQQERLVERVRAAGAVLVGPNSLGVVDNTTDVQLAWLGVESFAPGALSVYSQSGNVGSDICIQAQEAGLGVARLVSIGNQADLGFREFLADVAAHEPTRAVVLYCEDFGDARALFAAAQAVVEAGKGVVLLATGASEASSRAAQSHTGSMTSDPLLVAAACRAAGVVEAATPSEAVAAAQLLVGSVRPRGRRIGIVSDGAGHGLIAADAATAAGLDVVRLSDDTATRLRDALDPTASTENPVDLAAANVDPTAFPRAAALLAAAGEVDGVMLAGGFGGLETGGADYAAQETVAARELTEIAARHELPLVMQTMQLGRSQTAAAAARLLPVYRDAAVTARTYVRVLESSTEASAVPALPAPAPPPARDGYFAARGLLLDAGLAFPEAVPVADAGEACAAAEGIGWPVALKAVSLLHKSDAGGVALGLADAAALTAAVDDMRARLGDVELSVEVMADLRDGVELLVGSRWDSRFGPVLMVGLGGVYAEVLRDVRVALAPVGSAEVERHLRTLRGWPLLAGARGRPPVDVTAAARAASALAQVASAHPSIAEIEVNPLLVTPAGAWGLDARMILAEEEA